MKKKKKKATCRVKNTVFRLSCVFACLYVRRDHLRLFLSFFLLLSPALEGDSSFSRAWLDIFEEFCWLKWLGTWRASPPCEAKLALQPPTTHCDRQTGTGLMLQSGGTKQLQFTTGCYVWQQNELVWKDSGRFTVFNIFTSVQTVRWGGEKSKTGVCFSKSNLKKVETLYYPSCITADIAHIIWWTVSLGASSGSDVSPSPFQSTRSKHTENTHVHSRRWVCCS